LEAKLFWNVQERRGGVVGPLEAVEGAERLAGRVGGGREWRHLPPRIQTTLLRPSLSLRKGKSLGISSLFPAKHPGVVITLLAMVLALLIVDIYMQIL
jgi:hypothetical protein